LTLSLSLSLPFSLTLSLYLSLSYTPERLADCSEEMADDDDDQLLSADKRGRGVDAWSICPPHMTDVDCFYAYLRVYARLRKAAEASDRVSMRNIGKRGQSAMTSTSLSESDRARTKLKLVKLCPDGMSPAGCFQLTKRVYQQVLSNLQDAALKTPM
ncbi:uncharacterized protein, partial [Littorina saxatilis]|uniref:uncharacterized protein n=1 Tax=Littorina saxatilis TaxID=31220 RepID=UPI0038B4E8E5